MRIGVLIAVLVVLGGYIAFRSTLPASTSNANHTWALYANTSLGISFDYPADLLMPAPSSALPDGDTASTSVVFTRDATTTPTQRGFSPHIVVNFQPTNEPDTASFLADHDFQIANGLSTTTTISGVPVVELSETAYAYKTLYAIFNHRFYTISIDLPPVETDQVISSIQFGTASWRPYTGWAAILACYPKSSTGAEDTPIPNNSVQQVKETSRMFINMPKDLYPKDISHSWTTVSGNATAGWFSNSGLPGEGLDATPGCWSTGVDFEGSGEVDLRVKSITPGAPNYFVRFIVSPA